MQEPGLIGQKLTLKVKIRKKDAPVESVKFGGHGVCDSLSKSSNVSMGSDLNNTFAIQTAVFKEAWKLLKLLNIVSQTKNYFIDIQSLNFFSTV